MARPPIERAVSGLPRAALFKPAGIPARELEQLRLTVDGLEAIRLADREGLSHEQAAAAMGVSRQTVGRVLEHGRAAVAEALIEGKAILIEGGQYRVTPHRLRCLACELRWPADDRPNAAAACPCCGSTEISSCWGGDVECGGRGPGGGRHGRGDLHGSAAAISDPVAAAARAAIAAASHRSHPDPQRQPRRGSTNSHDRR